jgi:hypothetical protein
MTNEYLHLERQGNNRLERFCGFSQYNSTGDGDKTESLIVCSFNIQNLVAHDLDLSSDSVTSGSDCLALTETWMDKDKTFDIPVFKHIESKECDRHGDDDVQQPRTSRGTGKKLSGLTLQWHGGLQESENVQGPCRETSSTTADTAVFCIQLSTGCSCRRRRTSGS